MLPIGLELQELNQRYDSLMAYTTRQTPIEKGTVTLFGWSEDPLDMVTVKGEMNNRSALYLVRQNLEVTFEPGEKVFLTSELLPTRIAEQSGQIVKDGFARTPVIGQGFVTFEVRTQSATQLKANKIHIRFDHEVYRNLQKKIYNLPERLRFRSMMAETSSCSSRV
ncbi:hypothetical protein [Effusibacillus consociatus]|uniref:Uncharacterized protein n=1 Tax=Effusibacillus consociatus TaxID=1117041 RepID=A0ABV9Q0B0_9BACL